MANTSKFVTTNPEDLLTTTDSSSLDSLGSRGDGNTFILDSIATTSETSTTDTPSTTTAQTATKAKADIQTTLDDLEEKDQVKPKANTPTDFNKVAANGSSNSKSNALTSMTSNINILASTGDVLGLSSVKDSMTSAGFDSNLLNSLAPNSTSTALGNFNLKNLMPDMCPDFLDEYIDQFNAAIVNLCNDWYWLDKDLGIYNYNILSKLPSIVITFLEYSMSNQTVVKLARALHEHRDNTEEE